MLSWVPLRPEPPWPLQPSLQPAQGRAGTQGPVAAPACPYGDGSLSARPSVCRTPSERDGVGHRAWERLGRHPPRSGGGVGLRDPGEEWASETRGRSGPPRPEGGGGWSLPVAVRCPWEKNVDFLKFFFFGHAACLAGSQFPEQGLNLGHNRKPRILTTRPLRKPPFKSLSFDTFPEVLHRFELEKSGRPNSKA